MSSKAWIWIIIIVILAIIVFLIVRGNGNTYNSPNITPTTTSVTGNNQGGTGINPNNPYTQAAILSLSEQLKVATSSIFLSSVVPRDWPNSCLGIASTGTSCAQVITPGYEVTLMINGQRYVYRTNASGTLVVREP